jgi:hypothetical protein
MDGTALPSDVVPAPPATNSTSIQLIDRPDSFGGLTAASRRIGRQLGGQ